MINNSKENKYKDLEIIYNVFKQDWQFYKLPMITIRCCYIEGMSRITYSCQLPMITIRSCYIEGMSRITNIAN